MILLTGGCGYIGSHTLLALLNAGYKVIVLDDLSTGSLQKFDRACELSTNSNNAIFKQGDMQA
ncbi:NAD-dependent epimerase/dehydratase family protein [Psychrobacter pygoscelis]|uniref:NAD-dependent epimerase/dehydratase family protein n=1 Tax=Psychrobacter pygoscelis TaxID=2488563 RepID=UPI00103E75E6|nr:GDP-mannose 4,6-dehydratase [Psychrobacter pygoscelis]